MRRSIWQGIVVIVLVTCVSWSSVIQPQVVLTANTFEKITLDFKKIAIRELLQLVADYMHCNIILSESVTGFVSLHFNQVTWQEALHNILEVTGFVVKRNDNTLIIATPNEFAARQKNLSEAALMKTIRIQLKHADVGQILPDIKSQLELLSTTARVSGNSRDNSLWLKENAENIPEIQRLIQQLDQPEQQLCIAAKIVNVDDSKRNELGLKFDQLSAQATNKQGQPRVFSDEIGKFNFAIATFMQNQLLNLQLEALAATGHSKIIANPRIIAQNHRPALIEAGEEIPYQEKTASGATSVEFKKAALSLKVTPTILPDHRINLELEIKQNKISPLSVNGTPAIQTQELKTQVVLGSNQSVILGGIFETTQVKVVKQVPLLGSVPLLGYMFQHNESQQERKELLIIITPQLLLEE